MATSRCAWSRSSRRPTWPTRWVSAFPGQPLREENSTLVEFTLTPEGDKTRLHVVESGFAAPPTPENNRQNVIKDHSAGWSMCMDTLRERAEKPGR